MKKKMLSGFTLAVALSGLIWVHQASAFEMTMEISNFSGTTANVEIYAKSATTSATRYSSRSIQNGTTQTTTFLGLTGVCPSYLTGTVGNVAIMQMTCSGAESSSTSERCCANLKFSLYKKPDGTYHFARMQQID